MKKYLISFLIVLICNVVFAAVTVQTDFSTITTRPSQNVDVAYDVANLNVDFILGTKHLSGDRLFVTTNNTSKIYYKSVSKGQSLQTGDIDVTVGASVTEFSDWTAL
jgi:hypothetical protein